MELHQRSCVWARTPAVSGQLLPRFRPTTIALPHDAKAPILPPNLRLSVVRPQIISTRDHASPTGEASRIGSLRLRGPWTRHHNLLMPS